MNTSAITETSFTSQQILKTITGVVPSSSAIIYRKINELIAAGTIIRTDRNTYTLGNKEIKPYLFDYLELARDIASLIEINYTDVNFTVFETRQFQKNFLVIFYHEIRIKSVF